MTHSDYTREILNIKDENIYFNENCLKIVNIKGKQTKVFHGYLTYNPIEIPLFFDPTEEKYGINHFILLMQNL